ncbi:F-box-like/WD repeat-containing protein TBL1XR1 [Porphyridium purpureum]|uniref:F-box-like/WD repeat-containing protein TBL1XR1 n=1 Tax=Porphyridium purpureum TaxID=35688 RepID=A0A5J4YU54_PORPP|nr:F-box-like/WD repeat-containing protein TBL1XR1 [Porphyridium purpureum]|eukprot:POR4238..scf229_5
MANMITSEEVNYLIFRYLQESGYTHSAFAFGHESHVYRSNIDGSQIPPGVLLSFLQRGLSYVEIEASLKDRDLKENKDHTGVSSTASVLLDVHRILVSRQALIPPIIAGGGNGAGAAAASNKMAATRNDDAHAANGKTEPLRLASGRESTGARNPFSLSAKAPDVDPELMVNSSDTFVLRAHDKDVFTCSWNPRSSCLATGSADGTVRIWAIPHLFPSASPTAGPAALPALSAPITLHLVNGSVSTKKTSLLKSIECAALDWSPNGLFLCAGVSDGALYVWTETGEPLGTLTKHEAPIFCVKWSPGGAWIASGSVDKSIVLWNAETKTAVRTYKSHEGAVLDVSWLDEKRFASSSCGKTVVVHSVESETPLKIWKGHSNDVNAVRWSPSGTMLASCSDDCSVKLWSLESDTPVATLGLHTKEVCSIAWSPNSADHLLASASFDKTAIVWNVQTRSLVHTLTHKTAVLWVGFNPDGQLIATSTSDRWVFVWSVKDGVLVKAFRAAGDVHDVSWNETGDRLAACLADQTSVVFDALPASSAPIPMDKS